MNYSKIIIGINAFHADSSACLIIDGKLIAAIEEERINRIKHYSGLPLNAIKECLSIKKKKNIHKIFNEKLNLNKNVEFHYIEHHLAHIASAFYPSKFQKSNGLSIDGSGDFVSLAYAKCEGNKIIIEKKITFQIL